MRSGPGPPRADRSPARLATNPRADPGGRRAEQPGALSAVTPGRKVRRDRSYQGATRSGNIGKCLTLSVMSRAPCSSAVAATA